MKILYIHQYFKTPEEPGGTRSYWIARELVKEGHKVVMVTSSKTINKRKVIKIIDGIKVIYIRVPYSQSMSIANRLVSFLRFMFKASFVSFKERNVDLCIATSTPLTIGVPSLLLHWFRKVPYVFEVRDLWPEVPIQLGGLSNNFLQKIAYAFEKKIYKNATHIVALSPGMAQGVFSQGIPKDKVSMIPNMAKIDKFYPRAVNKDLQKQLGLQENTFKVIHFGALGYANGAHTILEGIKELKDKEKFEFIFLGGGAQEENLMRLTTDYKLNNVKFLGRQPMDITSEIVNMCDVSIVSFLDIPILYTNSPNKFFDSLSAGKPIIVNSAGWTKDIVENYNCGYFVSPNNPELFAERITYMYNHKEELVKMGYNSRILAETKYDKSILCAEYVNTLNCKGILRK